MYNPFLKINKIFIKQGYKLKTWDLFFQVYILLKLICCIKMKNIKYFFKSLSIRKYLLSFFKMIKKSKTVILIPFNINFFFFCFLENMKSNIAFISKIVSGKAQFIPYFALFGKDYTLSFRWFLQILKDINFYQNFRYFHERFFLECLNIYLNKGHLFSLREDFYEITLRNRNFLRFLKKK